MGEVGSTISKTEMTETTVKFRLVFTNCESCGEVKTKSVTVKDELAKSIPLISDWLKSSFKDQISEEIIESDNGSCVLMTATFAVPTDKDSVLAYIAHKRQPDDETICDMFDESSVNAVVDRITAISRIQKAAISTWPKYDRFCKLVLYLGESDNFFDKISLPKIDYDSIESEFAKSDDLNVFLQLNERNQTLFLAEIAEHFDLSSKFWLHTWARMLLRTPHLFAWFWTYIDRAEFLSQFSYSNMTKSFVTTEPDQMLLELSRKFAADPLTASLRTKLGVCIDQSMIDYLTDRNVYRPDTLNLWIMVCDLKEVRIIEELTADELLERYDALYYDTIGAYEVYMSKHR